MRTLALLALLIALPAAAQMTDEEKAELEKAAHKLVTFEPEKLAAPELAKVFDATFYRVKVRFNVGGSSTGVDVVMVKKGKDFGDVESTSTTMKLPRLQALLKADFRLKSDEDARTFQAALDAVYPMGWSDKVKGIKHDGTRWLFVRGKFFKKHKGFVATTDAEGKIVALSYTLDEPATPLKKQPDNPEPPVTK